MSAYDSVQKGGLKLKGVSDHGSKKKKKKDRQKKEIKEGLQEELQNEAEIVQIPKKTKAELAFEQARRKKLEEKLIEKASKSHKDRIMEFNRHLDSLTEHFDIPKVSWTK